MAEITASLVKELREKSGAGMMDCKKALSEAGGDLEQAVDWLRTKGLAAAAKKSGRIASEGLVGVAVSRSSAGSTGAIVEVNSETDFVARNDDFQGFVRDVTGLAVEAGDLDSLNAASYDGSTVAEKLTTMIATIGENMNLRRVATVSVGKGIVATYVHNALTDGLGKIGILVALESEGDTAKLETFGKQLAMHVAAAGPQSVSRDDLDPQSVDRERQIFIEQARDSGKPEEIVEKMVEGRLRKFYEEVCLLDQTFVIDGESKVSKAVEAAGKDAGGAITVKGFIRFALGEGIEKKEEDFAGEVAAAAGS
ncbi:MAG: elongation factor Ts [Rhodospirillaceae bacterium]|nr:elongation factor Ts [Rhodospirillaceae bacterium]